MTRSRSRSRLSSKRMRIVGSTDAGTAAGSILVRGVWRTLIILTMTVMLTVIVGAVCFRQGRFSVYFVFRCFLRRFICRRRFLPSRDAVISFNFAGGFNWNRLFDWCCGRCCSGIGLRILSFLIAIFRVFRIFLGVFAFGQIPFIGCPSSVQSFDG